MSQKTVISVFENRHDFLNLLVVNPGLIVVKLGATWCVPCKLIAPVVNGFFASSPEDVVCADIDVDENFDLYAYFKSKKMVNGIPMMLCYKKGNNTFIPDDSVTGSNPSSLDAFFKRCGVHLNNVRATNPNKIKIH